MTSDESVQRAVAAAVARFGKRKITGTTIAADGGRSAYLKIYDEGG